MTFGARIAEFKLEPSETTIRMASLHDSAGIAVPGGGSSADSSSDAASAVAAVKSSAKSNKQRMKLTLPPKHQKMFDAVRSELGSLGVDDLYSYILISIYINFRM